MLARRLPWLLFPALALLVPAAPAAEVKAARLVGTVTDGKGKPVAGATVLINQTQEAPIVGKLPQTTTDKKGRYELTLRFRDSKWVRVMQVWAWAEGCVRAELHHPIPLKDGERSRLDLTLARGEPLAGVMRLPQAPLEPRPEDRVVYFFVIGPKFRQVHWTEKGGKFKVTVPPGVDTIQTFPPDKFEWKGLKPGRTDLVLKPKPFVYNEANVGKVFDDLWQAMDRHYSYFTLKKDVDWDALRKKYRPRAVRARSARELAEVLKEMLAHLKDLHVWIATPEGIVGTFRSAYTPNWNREATLDLLREKTSCGKFAVVGKTKEGFGYFLLVQQSAADESSVRRAVEAIEKLHDAPGFLVDLRSANGGDERKAQQIARLFCAKKTIYARSKYRDGPRHDDFTRAYERWLEPAERPYTKPVVCLIGPGAVSSGEGFVQMMKALPHVTTVGLPTRGASGNPSPVDLPGTGLAVWFSRWVDLLPNGTPIEGVGIPPDVEVKQPPRAYADRDPTLEKALQVLRKKVARPPR